jgi:hypothetical protein
MRDVVNSFISGPIIAEFGSGQATFVFLITH